MYTSICICIINLHYIMYCYKYMVSNRSDDRPARKGLLTVLVYR